MYVKFSTSTVTIPMRKELFHTRNRESFIAHQAFLKDKSGMENENSTTRKCIAGESLTYIWITVGVTFPCDTRICMGTQREEENCLGQVTVPRR